MASPTGTWTVKENQSENPDCTAEITAVPRTANRLFRYQTISLAGAPLCSGEIVRQGPNHFLFTITEGENAGQGGELVFEEGATHPDTGEQGMWVWMAPGLGQGGHLT